MVEGWRFFLDQGTCHPLTIIYFFICKFICFQDDLFPYFTVSEWSPSFLPSLSRFVYIKFIWFHKLWIYEYQHGKVPISPQCWSWQAWCYIVGWPFTTRSTGLLLYCMFWQAKQFCFTKLAIPPFQMTLIALWMASIITHLPSHSGTLANSSEKQPTYV